MLWEGKICGILAGGHQHQRLENHVNLDVLCYHLRNSFWSSRRLKVHQHHLLLRLSNLGCRHLIVLVPNFRSGAPPFLQRTCCFLSGFRVGVRGLSVDCGGPWSGSEGVRESVGNGRVIYGFHDGQGSSGSTLSNPRPYSRTLIPFGNKRVSVIQKCKHPAMCRDLPSRCSSGWKPA